jgi:hypothetical protein
MGILNTISNAIFGSPSDASKRAMPYLNQIPSTITPYYQPYINAGSNALDTLNTQYGNLTANYPGIQDQYNQLMFNPTDFLKKLGQGYQQSPGYQFRVDEATRAANNAAAAGGMLGSPAEQQELGRTVSNIANEDFNDYLSNALNTYFQGLYGNTNLYNTGLQGISDINKMGYGASTDLAQNLAQALMSQANLTYAGKVNKNQQQFGNEGLLLGLATYPFFRNK